MEGFLGGMTVVNHIFRMCAAVGHEISPQFTEYIFSSFKQRVSFSVQHFHFYFQAKMADEETMRISGTTPAPKSEAIPQENETIGSSNAPYSGFTNLQRKQIALMVAFAAMFSPLSSFIYYPCIDSIAKDLGVTVELINLTITSYMIVSGIAPAIIGDFADKVGRRPIYIITFIIYFAANVGLAMQRSYPVLLVLRMVQSAGSSGEYMD